MALGDASSATATDAVALGARSLADRAGTISVGSAGNERQIANVADGSEGTDAVNKRQLDAAIATVGGDVGELAKVAVRYDDEGGERISLRGAGGTTLGNLKAGVARDEAVNVEQLDGVARALGGGAALGGDGLLVGPVYTVQDQRFGNVGGALGALDGALSGLDARVGDLERNGGAVTPPPTSGVPRGDGDGLAVGEGSMAGDRNDTAVGSGARAAAANSTAVGNNSEVGASATNAVAVGADSRVTASGATAIGTGATAAGNGSVALGQGSVASEDGVVSVGSAGNERRVSNVGTGINATDAANVAQVQEGDRQTLDAARSYTDNRLQALDDRFAEVNRELDHRLGLQDRRIDRQGAMSAAMLNMAINAAGSRSPRGRIAVGAGFQNSQKALSVGYGKQISERASFSLGGAFSGDDRSAGIGFGVDL